MNAPSRQPRVYTRGWPLARRLDFYSIPEPNSGCVLWTGATNAAGYGIINHQNRPHLAHRLSWQIANGPIPEALAALHKCDVRACINPDHIFLGTRADNNADMVAKKRNKPCRGEQQGNAKLSVDEVRLIRSSPGLQREIAAQYAITQVTVSAIKLRKSWAHVK